MNIRQLPEDPTIGGILYPTTNSLNKTRTQLIELSAQTLDMHVSENRSISVAPNHVQQLLAAQRLAG